MIVIILLLVPNIRRTGDFYAFYNKKFQFFFQT